MKTNLIEIGTGVLTWDRGERVSDRYGAVALYDNIAQVNSVGFKLPLGADSGNWRLVADVKETRASGHIGDLFHGVFPETPEVGERIVLGEGRPFIEPGADGFRIGLWPADGRTTLWLDIRALYRCHEQTVTLSLEKIGGAN